MCLFPDVFSNTVIAGFMVIRKSDIISMIISVNLYSQRYILADKSVYFLFASL